MTNKAFLGPILEIRGRQAVFAVRSYGMPIRAGTILKSLEGASVYVKCIRVREFEPEIREKKSIQELAKYVVAETSVNVTAGLDVEGDVNDFSENTTIYIIPRKENFSSDNNGVAPSISEAGPNVRATEKLERKGWKRKCPKCDHTILYSKFSGMSSHKTQFYDSTSNDFILVDNLPDDQGYMSIKAYLDEASIETSLDLKVWNNISCPKCRYEFPYAFQDLKQRLNDNVTILIDGAIMFDRGKKYTISVLIDNLKTNSDT